MLQREVTDIIDHQRYSVINPLPKDIEEIEVLAKAMYERMLKREDEAVRKLHQVIEFATADECEILSSS